MGTSPCMCMCLCAMCMSRNRALIVFKGLNSPAHSFFIQNSGSAHAEVTSVVKHTVYTGSRLSNELHVCVYFCLPVELSHRLYYSLTLCSGEDLQSILTQQGAPGMNICRRSSLCFFSSPLLFEVPSPLPGQQCVSHFRGMWRNCVTHAVLNFN